MKTPKTQKELVLWYLIEWNHFFTLASVIKHSMFYKFNTRLSELEKQYGKLAERKAFKFKNRFGHNGFHYGYKAIDVSKCKDLYNKLTLKD